MLRHESGRLDGAVLDVGHGASATTAVLGGVTVPGSVCHVPVAGVDITTQLQRRLFKSHRLVDRSSDWAWEKTAVWGVLKEKFARYAPSRQHTDAVWALRSNVLQRRHMFLETATFARGARTGLRRMAKRHRVGLLRYMLDFDSGMALPANVEPVPWELPDGTPLQLGSELAACTECLWRTAEAYRPPSRSDDAFDGSGGLPAAEARWRQRRRGQRTGGGGGALARATASFAAARELPQSDLHARPSLPLSPSKMRRRQQAAEAARLDPRVPPGSLSSAGAAADAEAAAVGRAVGVRQCPDLADAFLETLQAVPEADGARRKVCANTLICGGGTMHPGFAKRAELELRVCAGDAYAKDLKFWPTPAPLAAAYSGLALLANSSFRHTACMVTKEDYEEKGARAIKDHWVF